MSFQIVFGLLLYLFLAREEVLALELLKACEETEATPPLLLHKLRLDEQRWPRNLC